MKIRLIVLACSVASSALAQLGAGGYLGPGVLSSGATGVGNRSGQQMDLRFYAGVNGVYDSTFQPTSVDSKGNLVTVNGLEGAEASLGLYGSHSWKTALLGLDYRGVFDEYNNAPSFDSINQFLTLGYTWQQSQRLVWNAQALGGTYSNALTGIGIEPVTGTTAVTTPNTALFDSRSYYLQGGLSATYIQTPRTSYSFGGEGFEVWRQSTALVGVEGYNVRGTVEHKLSRRTSVGFTYQRQHFDFPKVFGRADIDTGEGFFGTNLGRFWSVVVRAGVFHSEVSGLQAVTLNPVIAALLGQSQSIQSFYRTDIYPSGTASLTRRFKTASLNFSYTQTVTPGNGVYLTSRNNSGTAAYSYTGIRKVNLSVSGAYYRLAAIGQDIKPYQTGSAGGGITYSLPWALHLTARYDYRYQEIVSDIYKHTGYRATVGILFSPGTLPLSLW